MLCKNGFYEFLLLLAGGGVYSRKEIWWHEKEKKFEVFNGIDGTMQMLTAKKIMDKKYTNIGLGIKKGAFWVNLKERS